MKLIVSFLVRMLPYALCALPVVVLFRLWGMHRLRRKGMRTTPPHEIGFGLFLLFLVALASQAVIPTFEITASGIHFTGLGNNRLNLIPGQVFADTLRELSRGRTGALLINFLGNVVMFMPLGFFPPLLWRGIRCGKTAGIGFCASLFIEVCQLAQARGSDIDDLWLNTLGAVVGYGLYALIAKKWSGELERFRVVSAPSCGAAF